MGASSSVSASSSSTPSTSLYPYVRPKQKYDVFLSFRGVDTRRNFTGHLKKAMDDQKMVTFMDYYDLESGEEITPAILDAIQRSMISVIVFSERYASSRWCLDELVQIMECKRRYKQLVIPVFYGTSVSDIRHQRGSYELEERFKDRTESERSKWKKALTMAANLSGFESTQFRDDAELVDKIVQFSRENLSYDRSSSYENGLVGIEIRVMEIISRLSVVPGDERVRILIVGGKKGFGKTTLVDSVFHHLSSQFDTCCFLAGIRKQSGSRKKLKDLRNKLLRDLLGDNTLSIKGKSLDSSLVDKIVRRKILVVLDDVDKSSQLQMLADVMCVLGSGSRIIITTRDMQRVGRMQILTKVGGNHDVEMYEVIHGLNDNVYRQAMILYILSMMSISTAAMGGGDMSC